MTEIPILLLAAGASSRMGKSKQLLPWGNHTLIEHQIQILLKTGNPVLVVLGHKADQIRPILANYPAKICINKQWKKGIGNSIARGITCLEKEFPKAAGVLICQIDQPLITSSYYVGMISTFQPGSKQIIVSQSPSEWQGVPVLFDRNYLDALKSLSGDDGARKVFRSNEQSVLTLEAGNILEDMDTPEVYQKLLENYRRQIQAKQD